MALNQRSPHNMAIAPLTSAVDLGVPARGHHRRDRHARSLASWLVAISEAMQQAWAPFALVAGLLMVGVGVPRTGGQAQQCSWADGSGESDGSSLVGPAAAAGACGRACAPAAACPSPGPR